MNVRNSGWTGGDRVSEEDKGFHPARLALGVALLAADRIRAGTPSDPFLVGVGLAQQTVAEVRGLARRALGPPTWAASRTANWASKRTGLSPNTALFVRSRERFNEVILGARAMGRATVAAGRQDADSFVRTSVANGLAWAGTQAVPAIVDSLVPHLVDSVVPRLIEGALPEIRSRVMPSVVDDLTNDPKVRDLVTEQSRAAVEDAVKHVHTDVAKADSTVLKALRRLAGAGPTQAHDDKGPRS
jgi:hypothetical protein